MAAPQAAPEQMSDGSPGAEGPQEEGSEDGMEIFREAAQAVSQAMTFVAKSPTIPEELKQMGSELLQKFGDFADAVMSASGGDQGGGPMPSDQGAVPMQAGMTGVPMGPQTPN